MSNIDIFSDDAFSLTTLTNTASAMPAVNVQLAQFFTQSSVATESVWIDRESGVLQVLQTGTRGVVSENTTGKRTRQAKAIGSVKVDTMIGLTGSDIQNTRAFGEESQLETFQGLVNQLLEDASADLDTTHENLRAGAFRGIVLDADGSELLNLYTLFGIEEPETVYLDFANTPKGKLKPKLMEVSRRIEDALGRTRAPRKVAVHGRESFRDLVNHPEVRDAYDRWMDGAFLRDDTRGFQYGGFEHIEYDGDAIAEDEVRFAPAGVRKLFQTVYTAPDNVDQANTLGRPTYVTPELADYRKGWNAEVASFPVHICSRPEALIGGRAGADTQG